MNVVILLGPPGAGKGTVAEVLVDQGCRHISTGQLLRDEIAKGSVLGLEAKKLIDQGQFVPDETVVGMIRDLLQSSDFTGDFLFDGFPRTIAQAEKLDELMKHTDGTISNVILLDCPNEVIVERLSGRRTCKKCGTVYHLAYNPPRTENQCDADGCQLIQRPDDKAETIRKRLEVYVEQTEPLIHYYEAQGLITRVNAAQTIEEVRNSVLEKFGAVKS
ncbi:adenylate kinase [Pontiella sp.]|uniref:adenylate kinase n=1 Tax=Pontiella sp. TaxID=2837462 RepID=UPI00356310A4